MSELRSEELASFKLTKAGEDLLEPCNAIVAAITKAETAIGEIEKPSNDLKRRINELNAPWWRTIAPQVDENLKEILSESKRGEFRNALDVEKRNRLLIERNMVVEGNPKAGQWTREELNKWGNMQSKDIGISGSRTQGGVDEIVKDLKTLELEEKETDTLKPPSLREGPISLNLHQHLIQVKDTNLIFETDPNAMPWQSVNGHNTMAAGAFVERLVDFEQSEVTADVPIRGMAGIILLKGWQTHISPVPSTKTYEWLYLAVKTQQTTPFVIIGHVTQHGVDEVFSPIEFDPKLLKVTLKITRDQNDIVFTYQPIPCGVKNRERTLRRIGGSHPWFGKDIHIGLFGGALSKGFQTKFSAVNGLPMPET